METRQQQELYSSVLGDGVVEWGPGEEWVNTAVRGPDLLGLDEGSFPCDDLGTEGWRGGRLSLNGDMAGLAEDTAITRGGGGEQGKMHDGSKRGPPAEEEEEEEEESLGGTSHYVSELTVVMAATWDMQMEPTGLLDSQPLREADEDAASDGIVADPPLTEEEREEIYQELTKLEEEISTLRQVLSSKEKQHSELKQKLGITAISEFRSNFSRGWTDMQSSSAYKKTSETLSTAGQKTTAAFSTLGCAITRKFGDMSMVGLELLFPRRSNSIGYNIRHSMSMPTMRNSPSFKSFEEKMESTVTNIKTKVGGTGGGGSFEEVLSSAAQASSAQDTPTSAVTDSSERPC